MKNELSFWITNLSNRNVSLTDLNLTVKAYTSVNLLDKKHYQYTLEQLESSKTSGSIFKKRKMIVVRQVAPKINKAHMPFLQETFIPSRERSTFSIKEEYYEELNVSTDDIRADEERFARENADIVELDAQPLLKKV